MVGVLPSRRTMGSMKTAAAAEIMTPVPKEHRMPVEATRDAASGSRAPRSLAEMLPEPMPNMKPTAWMSAMKPKTTPMAALWLVPSRPTKAVSTRL